MVSQDRTPFKRVKASPPPKLNDYKDQTVTIKVNQNEPESIEIIANAIVSVADAFDKINHGPLKRRAVVLLLRDLSGVSITDIEKILNAADKLKYHFIKS